MKTENKPRNIFEFEKKLLDTAEKYGMFSGVRSVTVALSGGADSVALLLSLKELSVKLGISLCACHLNHGIRGKEAERDKLFSENLCKKHNIPFYSETINIPELCKMLGGSIETVARNQRYDFFERAKNHFCSQKIATAHTMSDNTETVLFNLCRGSSADGMCGIPPVRNDFIRPLIAHTRTEIEMYLDFFEQDHIYDSTNSDQDYTRNYIRQTIIPGLKSVNPSLDTAVFRLSESQRADRNYFDGKTAELFENKLTVKEISALPQSLMTRYIRELCRKNVKNSCHISENHISSITDAILSVEKNGGVRDISLPEALCAHISEKGIDFCLPEKSTMADFDIPLSVGKNIINEQFAVIICENDKEILPDIIKNHEFVYRLYKNIPVSSAIIKGSVFARNRAPGDKIRIGNMSRLLKKVFSESGLSTVERSFLPVIYCEKGIVAVPLFKVSSDFAKPEKNENNASIAFYKKL